MAEVAIDRPGWKLVQTTWSATALLAVALAAGLAAPSVFGIVVVVVSLVMFCGGMAAFVWSYFIAADRSRTEELSVAGLYLLAEGAPRWARLHMMGSMGAQVVIAMVAALARSYMFVAFGILAPLFGMGLAGLWLWGVRSVMRGGRIFNDRIHLEFHS